MPPLTCAPGQRSLISGIASMNAFAKSSCSSIPVATASTFGSKTMSSGAKPASLGEQVVGALADRDLAARPSSAWPCSSKAITTTPAP